ncbi:MAG: glycosyltransferase [Sphingomonas sp.]
MHRPIAANPDSPSDSPTVSVIMAVYNGASMIRQTLDSLREQTFPDFELVVVDDCSTDDTLAVLRGETDPRFRVIAADANQGVVLARNLAAAAARGRYIAALDHDDLCHPDRLARQVAYLDAHPEIALLGTACDVLQDGAILTSGLAPLSTPALIGWLLRIENPLVWSSVMMRTEAVRALGAFQRPEMIFAEDFDLYHRIARVGGIARLDDPLVTYRRHSDSLSQRHTDSMTARSIDVLTADYTPLYGDAAAEDAGLIVRHVMGQRPVPDRVTYARVGEVLIALQDDFLRRHEPDPQSRALIRWETARRWARIGRAGLRAGHLNLGDAARVRPDHLGLGYAGIDELVLSRLVGSARMAQRRLIDRAAS